MRVDDTVCLYARVHCVRVRYQYAPGALRIVLTGILDSSVRTRVRTNEYVHAYFISMLLQYIYIYRSINTESAIYIDCNGYIYCKSCALCGGVPYGVMDFVSGLGPR